MGFSLVFLIIFRAVGLESVFINATDRQREPCVTPLLKYIQDTPLKEGKYIMYLTAKETHIYIHVLGILYEMGIK